jgi:hypothetical protein
MGILRESANGLCASFYSEETGYYMEHFYYKALPILEKMGISIGSNIDISTLHESCTSGRAGGLR